MMDMKPKNPKCFLHADDSSAEKTSPDVSSIDSPTTQAFQLLLVHAEDLALELAVRLRVLGKSLAAVCCQQPGGAVARKPVPYHVLRQQFENFLGSLADHGFAQQNYFPIVCHYLQDSLPLEPKGCSGHTCRIGRVEEVISLLSANTHEHEDYSWAPAPSFSL